MSVRVSQQSLVTLTYTLSTEDEIIDSTEGATPLRFRLGSGRVHPAIEKTLWGLKEGETFDFCLDPSVAFGKYNPHLRFQIPRSKAPEDFKNIEVGAIVELKEQVYRVTKVSEENFILDANPRYAGELIYFSGAILKVED